MSLLTRKVLLICQYTLYHFSSLEWIENYESFWTLWCSQSQDSYFGSRCSFKNEQFIMWNRKEIAPGLCHAVLIWNASHWCDSSIDWVPTRPTKLREQDLNFDLTFHSVLVRMGRLWKATRMFDPSEAEWRGISKDSEY